MNKLLAPFITAHKPEKVAVKSLKDHIFVRRMTVGEQSELLKFNDKHKDDSIVSALGLFIYGVTDKDGNRIATEDDLDDLKNIDSVTMSEIVNEVTRVNGFNKSVDDAEKNS